LHTAEKYYVNKTFVFTKRMFFLDI